MTDAYASNKGTY